MDGFRWAGDSRRKYAALIRGRIVGHVLADNAACARVLFARELGRVGLEWRRLGSVVREV